MEYEKTLPSGAKLTMTVMPFWDCIELNDAVMESLQGAPMDVEAFVAVAKSVKVKELLKSKALLRCQYDGQKIDAELFSAPNFQDRLRQDFYTVCAYVLEANCWPFFVKTFSALKTLFGSLNETNPK